ncbi:ROK family protein [Leifsonia sp. NPDC056824]|uniref:ROK family protein n=1 Tax=Leifsonia sp. NPDC056824 TaxID=3345953 RepID=UPI0036845BD3
MPTLAIDFGGTTIKLGLVADGSIAAHAALPNTGGGADLEGVRETALGLLTRHSGDGAAFSAVGIAMPGVVARSGALVAAHDKYGWAIGYDIRGWAEVAFGVPVVVENDARAALVGEVTSGSAAGATDAALLILGTGIGTAAIMDGRLVRGAHGHAGILGGHVTVELDGPACNCGNIGCAEAVASTWALARDVAAGRSGSLSGRDGLRELIEGADDPDASALLDRYVRAWGAATVSLCHAYDPDVVVVTGGVMRAAGVILPRLESYVDAHLWSSSNRPAFVVPTAPEHSVLLGLSALADGLNDMQSAPSGFLRTDPR